MNAPFRAPPTAARTGARAILPATAAFPDLSPGFLPPLLLALSLAFLLANPRGALAAADILRLPAQVAAPESGPGGEGLLRAKVAPRKVKHARVLASAALPVREVGPGSRELLLPERLSGYNEARFDYLENDAEDPVLAGCEIVASLPGQGSAAFASDPLESVERLSDRFVDLSRDSLPVAGADWREKGLLYRLRRALNLPPDEDWHYIQDGPSTFVQRRLDKDVTDIGAVDVLMRRGRRVQVNLVVSVDGGKPLVLDWHTLPKRYFNLESGRTVLRLYLGRALRQAYPGARRVILRETALLFFRQEEHRVLADRGVLRLVFTPSGLDPDLTRDHGLPRHLPTRAREPFVGRKELVVGLGPIERLGPEALSGARARLRTTPMSPGREAGCRLESARLAKVGPRRDIPAFLAETDALCARFGAECDIGRANGAQGQDLLWSVRLPFAETAPGAGRGPAPERPFGSDSGLTPIQSAGLGALFRAEGPVMLYKGPGERGGVIVEARSRFLEMPLPVRFATDPARRYGLWLELGPSGRELSSVSLTLSGPDRTVTTPVKPGAYTELDETPARVERAVLRFDFSGREASLGLRAVELSAARRGPGRTNIVAAPLAMPREVRPDPVPGPHGLTLAGFSEAGWLTFAFEAAGGAPSFGPRPGPEPPATPALHVAPTQPPERAGAAAKPSRRPGSNGLGGSGASAGSVAPVAPAASGAAAASGTPDDPAATATPARLATEARSGLAALYLPGLGLDGASLDLDLAPDVVTDISRPLFSGLVTTTWREVWSRTPLAEFDGRPLAPEGLSDDEAALLAGEDAWLPLARLRPGPDRETVRPLDSAWFSVRALLYETGAAFALSSLARPDAPPAAAGTGRAARGVLLILLALAALAGLSRLPLGRLLAPLARSLARPDPDPAGLARSRRAWGGLVLALLALGSWQGGPAGRILGGLAALASVWVWRTLAPAVARGLAASWPRLGAALALSPGRHYFLGFCLALGAATLARSAGLAPVSGFLAECGVFSLLAGLFIDPTTRRAEGQAARH